ncbi:4-hydroxythreonine-4-phosphate dehydrogenase PdxA [Nitrospira sp. Kam-Ns4a]
MTRQTADKPILGITMGDPAGIGPEVVAKAFTGRDLPRVCRPLVIGSVPVMEATVRALRLPLRVIPIEAPEDGLGRRGALPVLDPLDRPLGPVRMGAVARSTGAASVAFVAAAVRLAQASRVDAIVTAPINKEAINLAGYAYPGHTELLADLTGSQEVGMMIVGGPLRIMFTTTHVAIGDLPQALTRERVGRAIRLADRAMRELFGVPRPSLGVAALNPHAGEGGLFGREERTSILPAVRRARAGGLTVSDPLPADTLFVKAARGDYDAVVAMYHDQGLIPLKLLAFGTCVNLTVGLPIIRTSVDHGTAYDIAGQGVADCGSLVAAARLAARLAARRRGRANRSSVQAGDGRRLRSKER